MSAASPARACALLLSLALTCGCSDSHSDGDRGEETAAAAGVSSTAGAGGAAAGQTGDASNGGVGGISAQPSAGAAAGMGAQAGSAAMSAAGDDAATAVEADAATQQAAGDASEPLREVWGGELWSLIPMLCDANAPPTPELMVEPTGAREEVAMVLDPGADPMHPTGTIAFGVGSHFDASAVNEGTEEALNFRRCSLLVPVKGGEYSVLNARRSAERLSFEIALGEIWDPTCTDEASASCAPCQGIVCEMLAARFPIELVVRGDTMEGALSGLSPFGTPAELRFASMP